MSADAELPSWARVVLRLTLPEDERESVAFELGEAFAARVSDRGDADARRWLRRQVVGFALRLPRLRTTSKASLGRVYPSFAAITMSGFPKCQSEPESGSGGIAASSPLGAPSRAHCIMSPFSSSLMPIA